MRIFLGLGSNEGDRRALLAGALSMLGQRGLRVRAVSPVVESPALLPMDAPAEWNRPFLNLAVEGELDDDAEPDSWRAIAKEIEDSHGRIRTSRWAPRPLDIDILLWGRRQVRTDRLTIPHPDLLTRAFVLTPLVHLDPLLRIPGFEERTTFEWSQALRPIPLWMGIVNVTPDSFSERSSPRSVDTLLALVDGMVESGVHVVDIGAESTRPGASGVDWTTEWERLAEPLKAIRAHLARLPLPPRLSVDTRHWQVASRALEHGARFVNDVGALTDPEMQRVARDSDCEWVAVHTLTVPANPKVRLSADRAPIEQIEAWAASQVSRWAEAGIDPRRVFLDPGIGFGKDSLQSLQLLRGAARLRRVGLRLAIGHSRKSFMLYPQRTPYGERDLETLGASLRLAQSGVDLLRVHDVAGHARAYRAWAHVEGFANGGDS